MELRAKLATVLEAWELELLPRSYDIVGDIAVIRIPEAIEHRTEAIAEAIMETNKHVKTVLRQVSPVLGELRLRSLRWIAGEKRTETVHKEHGCLFRVNLECCYFSPRLSHERKRIAGQVGLDEVVINMFSGVGCYSIVIAKHSGAKKVFSIDLNPAAVEYQRENVRLNRVEGVVKPMLGDASEVIRESLLDVADRVLMPLPEKAYEYLDYAALASRPGDCWVHYYDFAHGGRDEKPVEKLKDKVSGKMVDLGLDFEVAFARIVRTVGPRWFQVVLDLLVHKESL